jgi:dienelactone hydrolase
VITLRSNFTNSGPRAVGALGAMNPFGTFDMAGNVREWTWNGTQNGDARFALGGAWNEPSYIFLHGDNREPLDRSSENGFRVARYADSEATARLAVPLEPQLRDVALEKPVSDEYFRFIARQFEYDAATPLDPRIEDSRDFTGWRTEKVTFNGPGGKERLAAYLYLPRNVGKPYQTLLYFPGANAGNRGSSNALMAGPGSAALESLIRSGRAILYPVYHGTYERSDGRDTWPEPTATYKDYSILQIKEARRAVDFMTSKPELLDPQRLGYLGVSWGANRGLLVLALEPRLKTGVFYSGGLNPSGVFPPEVDPTNFAPRVGVPVLMLNGSEDFISPVKLGQEPLLTLLGTARPGPAAERKHRVYSGGHGFLLTFPNQVAKETIEWLNKWLGSVPD